jgi:hypothetical protein
MNIFLTLGKWAKRHDEDFTTEAFALLLMQMLEYDPSPAGRILALITGGLVSEEDATRGNVDISTQRGTEWGVPDLWVEAPGKLTLIEVKTGAPLARDQLRSYRKVLRGSGAELTHLVLLTKYSIPVGKYKPDQILRWYEIAQSLNEIHEMSDLSLISSYLLSHFLGFLSSRNMAFQRVDTSLSKGLDQHRELYGDDSILLKHVKTLNRFAKFEELTPFHNVLHLMGQALDQLDLDARISFDTGQHGGGWAGYNIDRMKYWLCIYYDTPNILVVEISIRKGNRIPDSHPPFGEYFLKRSAVHWRNILDLSEEEGEFFELPSNEQFERILNFTRNSYSQAVIEKENR